MEIFTFSDEEQKKLKRLGVSALVLLGSRAQDLAREKSDYDIGVLLAPHAFLKDKRSEIYDEIYNIISSKINSLLNVDIVFLDTAPGELQAHVMKHGKVIFETKKNAFANFKEKTMLEYSDFAPLREMFHRAILNRIPA